MKLLHHLDGQRSRMLVPTMGALHAGHASLIRLAKQHSDQVMVSVFVNPLQFENPDDLAKYPKTLEHDCELAERAGADYLWAPEYSEIYPSEITAIEAGEVGSLFEGASRPGHFSGMLTVVHRLFQLVQPKQAIFGEKDLQQLFLVRQMVLKLKLAIEIIAAPIVRSEVGLALSSRNSRLSPKEQEAALAIYRALRAAYGANSLERAQYLLNETLAQEPLLIVDYASLINSDTFEIAQSGDRRVHAIVAGWINGVRLIDNMQMKADAS